MSRAGDLARRIDAVAARIAPWAIMDLFSARTWALSVRSRVEALLPLPDRDRVRRVEIAPGSLARSPYGFCIGSWIEWRGDVPVIRVLAGWALPLAFALVHAPAAVAGDATAATVRARLRMAVTNDVWQPFVPGPPAGGYSMIRHHALMLAAAWTWLPPPERALWLRVLEASADAARSAWRDQRLIGPVLDRLDAEAWTVWSQRLAWIRRARSASEPSAQRDEVFRVMAGFSLGASLAVLALVRDLETVDPPRWTPTLRRWAEAHRRPDFNREAVERLWRSRG